MKVLAGGLVGAAIWLVTAALVPTHQRLAVSEVVVGAVMTQPFGCTTLTLEPFDAHCPSRHTHTGVDLAAAVGTEVHSATFGSAVTGYDPTGCGAFVVVVVDPRVRVIYCHLSALRVLSGDAVTAGQVIGLVGSTGVATGAHLHLQVDVENVPVDPAAWLGP